MKNRWVQVAAITISAALADFLLPYRHLPWRPLAIDEPLGFATGFKLSLLNYTPRTWCSGLVERSDLLRATRLDAKRRDNGCGWTAAYQLQQSGVVSFAAKRTSPMQCALTAASHIWLASINRLAQKHLGTDVARIHHAGTYSCRRMYNRSSGPMSEHAYANAWDVTGFELTDGRVISVKKHWQQRGSKRDFLHAARDSACGLYNVVLSPDYNAAHHDHLHLDMGHGFSCR